MNVSKKVLVIIYIIFALLTSVVIFASQGILYSSYSNLEKIEANVSEKSIQNVIDFQTAQLDETNSVLSSREDIRAFMLSPEHKYLDKTAFADLFSLNGYDFIFLTNSSGNIIYSQLSGLNSTANASILSEMDRKTADKSLLCKEAESSLKGLLMLENGPAIISCRPVLASPGSNETIGTVILGKNLDTDFIASVQNVTGYAVLPYSPNSMSPDVRQAFLEDQNTSSTPGIEGEGTGNYFVLDIYQNPAFIVPAGTDKSIYEEIQNSLRYIVLFLLFAGLVVGAGCKLLLDREVVSRIVAIDSYVEKVGKDEDFSARYFMEGNDELSRLTEGINRMLDRLKTSSDKFKAQEHEEKAILNSLSELMVFVDPDLRIVWANRAFLDYVGLKLEELVGREFENLLMMYEEDSSRSFIRKALESGIEELGEVNTPDGKIWLIRANIIKDEDGRITGVLQTGLDITAHKHSEERLLQAKLEAEAANRTKSEFLANMSHELRTPLNSIIGFSDILLERIFGELNEKQLRYVNNISASGKHLLELINEILDLTKVEAGKMELHYSEFSINSVFEEVRAFFAPLAQKKSLEVTFSVESVTTLEADRGRLIQILYNLVSNAIKFTPDGGNISVNCKKSGSRAFISVVDTGIGISSEDQRKIFQPFTQIDASTSRQYCGTGLGLTLVKKIANLHQGEIWVESDIGKGSTFILAIPLKKPAKSRKDNGAGLEDIIIEFEMNKIEALSVKECIEDSQEEIELPEIYLPEKADSKHGLVLVVDDDKNSNELLSIVLREAGFSVAPYYSGKNLLKISKKLKPDIITLDILLPDTNGWLVLRQLKNDPITASIPVLIISVTNNNELGIAFGATYSFTKPVRRTELVDSLKKIKSKLRLESPGVLIIDDDENTLELLNSMIEHEGFEVTKAHGGKEGLEKLFSERQPDILILDLMMPEVSGLDIISSLRADARTKDIPLIVCTSGDFTEKNIDELNGELKEHLVSIMKKGTFGRKELINRIKQLAMLKRRYDEKNPDR
jgi:PAS domain S-box-containing protein